MKRYRLKRIPITSHSYMEQDMLNGKWVEFEDVIDTIRKLEALRNEVKAWRRQSEVFENAFPGQPERYQTHIEVSEARKATDTLNALE